MSFYIFDLEGDQIMKTIIIILLLTGMCIANVLRVGSKVSNSSEIDALVEKFSVYFDKPMSFCEVTPVSIKATKTGTIDGRIDIEVDVSCDGTEAHEYYASLVKAAIGKFDRKTGEYDGLIGNLDSRNLFFNKMNKRYPWFSMRWNYTNGAMYVRPDLNYVAHSNINPIWFSVSVNNKTLHDNVTKKSADYGIDSLCLLDAGISPAEYIMDSPNADIETTSNYTRTITYWVDVELINKINGKDVDVKINRVYKVQTKGFLNRTYRFPSMNM